MNTYSHVIPAYSERRLRRCRPCSKAPDETSARVRLRKGRPQYLKRLRLDSEASERLYPALLDGQLRVAHEELLERDRCGHSAGKEARRSIADVLPRVRCPTRDEYERSRRRLIHVVSEPDPEPAFQNPDELVLIPVHVKRRTFSGQRDRIDRRQHSTTLIAHDLEGQDSADGILDRHACSRGDCERLHLWSAMISACHSSAAQPPRPAHSVNLASFAALKPGSMNSKIGGPGWDRTNDQPIMSRPL